MSDKPKVGDLVWINVHDETYATNWKDHPSAIGPVLPTEIVQIKQLMDAMRKAVAHLMDDMAPELRISYAMEHLDDALDAIKADGRVTIEREEKP